MLAAKLAQALRVPPRSLVSRECQAAQAPAGRAGRDSVGPMGATS